MLASQTIRHSKAVRRIALRKGNVGLALLVLLLVLLSIYSQAQVNSCKAPVHCDIYSQWYVECIPVLPPNAYGCEGNGPFSAVCKIPNTHCTPNFCPTCNETTAGSAGSTTAVGGEPINLATGDTYVRQTDIALPGLGGGLTLTREWHSVVSPEVPQLGMFGHQWSSTFEESVFIGNDHMIKYSRGDASLRSYGFAYQWGSKGDTPTYYSAAPRDDGAKGVYFGTYLGIDKPYWTLTSRNGETRRFDVQHANDSTFYLSTITDRNNNTVTLTRDDSNRLTGVTDAASRHLYFTYGNVMAGGVSVSVVTNVTSDFGVSLSYEYDAMANLKKVIKPDNTFVTLEYNPAGLLTAVKDSNGKLLESHTYDTTARGLTSSRAGGVESLTISY
jgi:YD repeat-containing protein